MAPISIPKYFPAAVFGDTGVDDGCLGRHLLVSPYIERDLREAHRVAAASSPPSPSPCRRFDQALYAVDMEDLKVGSVVDRSEVRLRKCPWRRPFVFCHAKGDFPISRKIYDRLKLKSVTGQVL